MVVLMSQSYAKSQLEHEIRRLTKLVEDLVHIRDGKPPNEEALQAAPHLEGWALRWRTVPCLTGLVSGHPHIEDGDNCTTTEVWALAPKLGYARTTSRFYSLGRPLGASRDQ